MVTAQGRELGSLLSPGSGLSALSQSWWSGSRSRTAARKPPSCVQATAGQLEGRCLQLGRGQQQALLSWAPDPQALAVVDSGPVPWFAVLGGQKTGWAGRHWVPARGAWEGCSQSVTAPGWGLISL